MTPVNCLRKIYIYVPRGNVLLNHTVSLSFDIYIKKKKKIVQKQYWVQWNGKGAYKYISK